MDSRLYMCVCVCVRGICSWCSRKCFCLCARVTSCHHVCVSELKESAEATQTQHRSEKQRRKQMQLKLSSLEEELQDLKTEKESLDRVRNL